MAPFTSRGTDGKDYTLCDHASVTGRPGDTPGWLLTKNGWVVEYDSRQGWLLRGTGVGFPELTLATCLRLGIAGSAV